MTRRTPEAWVSLAIQPGAAGREFWPSLLGGCVTWFGRGLAACLLLGPVSVRATPHAWTGVVSHVVDGDTVHVRPDDGGRPRRVRLAGIDAPEICQLGGLASQAALRQRLLGRAVTVTTRRQDDYGRDLAGIELQQEDIARWMVHSGHAWSYRSRRDPSPYAPPERQARQAGRGIFAEVGAEYPGDFRRRHGSCYVGS